MRTATFLDHLGRAEAEKAAGCAESQCWPKIKLRPVGPLLQVEALLPKIPSPTDSEDA